jgi:TRAP-type transport system small permease protein
MTENKRTGPKQLDGPHLDALLAGPPTAPVQHVPPPQSLWRKFTAGYAKLLEVLLAACVGILIFPVTLQIISRFTNLLPHYIWTEEMARFLFVWTIMIGAMVGVRDSQHFEVDIWPNLSRKGEAAVRIVARLGILALSFVFVWSGIEFTKFALNRTSELADLPLWMIHIAWPVAGLTWVVFAGEQIVDELRVLFGAADPAPTQGQPS